MRKLILICFAALVSSFCFASPAELLCKNAFARSSRSGGEAKIVTFKLSLQENQTYTAELDIIRDDEVFVAHERLDNLRCSFRSNSTLVVRCDLDHCALEATLVTSVGADRVIKEISLSLDAPRDNDVFIPYGYGDILFDLKE